jgi:ribosome-associated protein
MELSTPSNNDTPTTIETVALAARLLDDRKAREMKLLDLRGLCDFTDFFVIAEVDTITQLRALAENLRFGMKHKADLVPQIDPMQANTTWMIVDGGGFVVHLFLPEARQYYNLERLWGDAPELDWQTMEGSEWADTAMKELEAARN